MATAFVTIMGAVPLADVIVVRHVVKASEHSRLIPSLEMDYKRLASKPISTEMRPIIIFPARLLPLSNLRRISSINDR